MLASHAFGRTCIAGFLFVALAVSCSSTSDLIPDALTDSTGADTETDASSGDPITVTVYSHDQPGVRRVGATVVFQAPDHTTQTVFTDVNGVAAAFAPAGSTVTAIQTSVSSDRPTLFSSFQMLRPGDSVTVGPSHPPPHPVGDIRLEFPEVPNGRFYTAQPSCPFSAALVDFNVLTVARFTPQAPCSTLNSAMIIGRVKDASNNLLGVSVVDNVDLTALLGGSFVMPPFDVSPQPITGIFHNVPTTLDWVVGYGHGDEDIVLEHSVSETTAAGEVELETLAYPVGDESTFNATFLLPTVGGTHSTYHGFEMGRVTHFELDASSMILSILALSPTSTHDAITWQNSGTGRDPSVVVALIESDGARGVIYAPYTGPSLALVELPDGLVAPLESPKVERLKYYDADGLSYREVVSRFEELAGLAHVGAFLPFQLRYWSSASPSEVPNPG